ncbi:hypothetical protein DPMN_044944 [Dreissena polymorpha]|uniref:Uncharacterized protein n=1 Tax=Dreissena polymorpha TaxID=45954 RepID=A0A9D4I0X7_DREPO|nr:hypothetical protein DPMN_044944 [Dreissena polymorpha]
MSKPAIYLSYDRFSIWISGLTSKHDVSLETVNPLALAPEMALSSTSEARGVGAGSGWIGPKKLLALDPHSHRSGWEKRTNKRILRWWSRGSGSRWSISQTIENRTYIQRVRRI